MYSETGSCFSVKQTVHLRIHLHICMIFYVFNTRTYSTVVIYWFCILLVYTALIIPREFIIDGLSVERNHILVRIGAVGGPSERRLPPRALQKVWASHLTQYTSTIIAMIFFVCKAHIVTRPKMVSKTLLCTKKQFTMILKSKQKRVVYNKCLVFGFEMRMFYSTFADIVVVPSHYVSIQMHILNYFKKWETGF